MMDVNDDLNEIPPHENLINEKRFNYCIGEQIYQVINEKKSFLHALKAQRDELLVGFEANNQSVFTKNELITNIMLKKLNIEQLKDELAHSSVQLKQVHDEIGQIKKRISKKKQSLATYGQKIEKCKEMLERSESAAFNKTNNEKDGFNILKQRLIEYEKQRIDELNRFIFELVEIKPKEEDMLQKSTRTALKDARQTVYVNGRWILANDHVIYRIVRATLPTDGDYMPYFKEPQLRGPKGGGGIGGGGGGGAGGSGSDDEKLGADDHMPYMGSTGSSGLNSRGHHHHHHHHHHASSSTPLNLAAPPNAVTNSYMLSVASIGSVDRRSILAALTFSTQFVNLIAFYLNIVLPYNIPHNKFSTQTLNDDQFQNAVAKLNTNIVYLCINQHIPVTNLLPKHTLENLHHFLTYFREMRIKIREKHSIAFPNHIIPLLDEMFTDSSTDEDTSFGQDSMPNLIFTDTEDWETVPNSNEIPSDDTYNSRQTRTVSTSLISSVLSQFWFKNNPGGK